MPRFVILEHDWPALHWDLMLESGEVLRTWRLAAPPEDPDGAVDAEPSFEHRLHYLDYEGPVSGNRGTVRRWDAGAYRLDHEQPGRLRIWFDGLRIAGWAVLEGNEQKWSLRRLRSIPEEGEPGDRGGRAGEDAQ